MAMSAFGKPGHLRDRAGRRLHGDANAVLFEQPALLRDVDAPVEAAGEHVDGHLARTLRRCRARERKERADNQRRAPEQAKSRGFHHGRTPSFDRSRARGRAIRLFH